MKPMAKKASVRKKQIYPFLKKRDGLICGICGGDLTDIWNRYEEWCAAVNAGLKPPKRKDTDLSIDHKIPRAVVRRSDGIKGKVYDPWEDINNLQLAHMKCNNEKADRTTD